MLQPPMPCTHPGYRVPPSESTACLPIPLHETFQEELRDEDVPTSRWVDAEDVPTYRPHRHPDPRPERANLGV
jgi:hypothetical protein